MKRLFLIAVVVALSALSTSVGQAKVVIETVPVGDSGNVPDTRYDPVGYGGVDYFYRIGKFEVTAGQYCEFLNKVAGVDRYGLYHPGMAHDYWGSEITRTGAGNLLDPYTYSVSPAYVNRPVNYISWGDAARFCNWMHNGQPSGRQDIPTTEDGSYYLNSATSDAELLFVTREPDATWVIPSEDEWYKAAYYRGGGTNTGYWDYPT